MATITATQSVRTSDHFIINHKPAPLAANGPNICLPTPAPTPLPRHKALIINARLKYELTDVVLPELGPNEVLIRNKAVGLNPIDWKTVDYNFCMPSLPWINGRECAGVVEDVGSEVTFVSRGQRVWTSTYYRDRRAGCFQDLVVAHEHTVIQLPNHVSFESAASLGVGGLTAAMTIWKWFRVPMRRRRLTRASAQTRSFVLVWGGSTITGQFAIQIAAEAGHRVIAVASERTASKVASLGAEYVVARDGKSLEQITTEVQSIGQDGIVFGMDLVGPHTAICGIQCLSRSRHAKFAPLAVPAPPIEAPDNVKIVNVEMKRFVLDSTSRQYGVKLTEMVGQGRVNTPNIAVLPGGLQDIEAGLQRLKGGDMGGMKLVISM